MKCKNQSLKITFAKLGINNAKRYRCIKTGMTPNETKVTFLKEDLQLVGNRILNFDKLQNHVMELTTHTALCK